MQTQIVGVDCATEDKKVGLALATFDAGKPILEHAELCARERTAEDTIAKWLSSGKRTLLAIDAPLGWPVALAAALRDHSAGVTVGAEPNEMFRRATDRFIQDKIGKTPLDVGADRIARTAHSALRLLGALRARLKLEIPLAWDQTWAGAVAAIEVYPAATLASNGFPSTRYKKKHHVHERRAIVDHLRSIATFHQSTTTIEQSADALDAVVCAIAGADFLMGTSLPPVDEKVARTEGWIWVRDPRSRKSTDPE